MSRLFWYLLLIVVTSIPAASLNLGLLPLQNMEKLSADDAQMVQNDFRQAISMRPGFILRKTQDLDSLYAQRPELQTEQCDMDCMSAIGFALEVDRIMTISVISEGNVAQLQAQLINPATKRVLQIERINLGEDLTSKKQQVNQLASLFSAPIIAVEDERKPDATSGIINSIIGGAALIVLISVLYLLIS